MLGCITYAIYLRKFKPTKTALVALPKTEKYPFCVICLVERLQILSLRLRFLQKHKLHNLRKKYLITFISFVYDTLNIKIIRTFRKMHVAIDLSLKILNHNFFFFFIQKCNVRYHPQSVCDGLAITELYTPNKRFAEQKGIKGKHLLHKNGRTFYLREKKKQYIECQRRTLQKSLQIKYNCKIYYLL